MIKIQYLRAIKSGMCSYESVKNGDIEWNDIVDIIDYISTDSKIKNDYFEYKKQNNKK